MKILIGLLFVTLFGCNEQKQTKVIAIVTITQDSVEVTFGDFLAEALNKEMTRYKFVQYCRTNGLQCYAKNGSPGHWGRFLWYDVVADRKYSVGFYNNKMFAFH